MQEMIADCEDSLDTNSTATPDAALPPHLGSPQPLIMSSMQQDLLSMPFCEGAASAQGQYVPSMSVTVTLNQWRQLQTGLPLTGILLVFLLYTELLMTALL